MKLNKKAFVFGLPIIFVGLLAVIGLMFSAGYVSVGEITGSGGYIERPVFKWVKCEATGDYKYFGEYDLQAGGEWLYKPSVTDKYDVIVSWPDSQYRIEWWVCNSKVLNDANCRIDSKNRDVSNIQQKTLTILNVKPEEFVWVKYEKGGLLGLRDSSEANYKIGLVPYGLRVYDVLHSGGSTLLPNDCTVPANQESYKDRLISTDSKKVGTEIQTNGKLERELGANEIRNYVTGYVTSPAEDKAFFTYKDQDAWCLRGGNSGQVFKVNKVVTGSGTYKVASLEYSDLLGNVECCPGDKKPGFACNDNKKWVSNQPVKADGTTQVQCSAFNPCQGGSLTPYDKNTLAKYSCVEGKCVLETKKVECASNSDCSDSNQLCDTNTWKCVNANVNLKGQVIKTQADNSVDCKAQGGVWVSESTTSKDGTFCFSGFGICSDKVTTQNYCKFSKFNWNALSWVLFSVALISLFYFFRGQIMSILMWIRGILRI